LYVSTVRAGELDEERRSLAMSTAEADLAAVRLDDVSRHRQTEPGARDPARGRIGAEELREDP
jgi:hypothetical protein